MKRGKRTYLLMVGSSGFLVRDLSTFLVAAACFSWNDRLVVLLVETDFEARCLEKLSL